MDGARTATWGLMVGEYRGSGSGLTWMTRALGHTIGTRRDARRALYEHALHHVPVHPRGGAHRRWVHDDKDGGYLLVVEGTASVFHCRFTLARLLHDSAAPHGPAAAPPTVPPPPAGPPPGA